MVEDDQLRVQVPQWRRRIMCRDYASFIVQKVLQGRHAGMYRCGI